MLTFSAFLFRNKYNFSPISILMTTPLTGEITLGWVKYYFPHPRPARTLFFLFLLPHVFGGLCEIWGLGVERGRRDA